MGEKNDLEEKLGEMERGKKTVEKKTQQVRARKKTRNLQFMKT